MVLNQSEKIREKEELQEVLAQDTIKADVHLLTNDVT